MHRKCCPERKYIQEQPRYTDGAGPGLRGIGTVFWLTAAGDDGEQRINCTGIGEEGKRRTCCVSWKKKRQAGRNASPEESLVSRLTWAEDSISLPPAEARTLLDVEDTYGSMSGYQLNRCVHKKPFHAWILQYVLQTLLHPWTACLYERLSPQTRTTTYQ